MTNAITRRVEHIQNIWDKFRNVPDARLCRWHVKQDELNMIDTFYQCNSHETSETPDIFIRFETPFLNSESYSKALSEELTHIIEDDRIALSEEGIDIDWQSEHTDDAKNTALGFLRNFFRFADSLDLDEEEDFVVAFLSPADIKSATGWSKWWADAAELNLPNKIRLMVCDTEGYETLDKIAHLQKQKMLSVRPDLKMNDAIRELMNEFGDQEDNCTHFRKAFFELTQTIATKDVSAIRERAATALNLARLIDFPHLEVAVLSVAATGFATAGQLNTAMQTFDEASRIAKTAEDKPLLKEFPDLKVDLPGGNLFQQLGVQIMFFKASAYIAAPTPQYDKALAQYQQAETQLNAMIIAKGNPEKADWMNGGILVLHRLEALRMCGYCFERLKRPQEALKWYAKAVTIGEKLDAEARQGTTLGFVGQAMLTICKKAVMKEEYYKVFEKMNELLGKGWEKPFSDLI